MKRKAGLFVGLLPNNPVTLKPWTRDEILRVFLKSACKSIWYSLENQQDMIDLHTALTAQALQDAKIDSRFDSKRKRMISESNLPYFLRKQAE
jgi:hypothetical protein